MAGKAPRYDLPNQAPGSLRIVQRFVNTVNLERGDDWLPAWLEEKGVASPSPSELARARRVREALRELLYANNGFDAGEEPGSVLREAGRRAAFTIDFERGELVPAAEEVDGVVGAVLAAAFAAMAAGTWPRLKACRNHGCRWAFYDYSRNRSGGWCSMQLCGNRTKTRAYRRRQRTA